MIRSALVVAGLFVVAGCGGIGGEAARVDPTGDSGALAESSMTSSVSSPALTSSNDEPSEQPEPNSEPPVHAPPTYDVPLGPATLENLNRVAADVAPALTSEPDIQVGGTTVTFLFAAGALVDAAQACAVAVPAFETAITEPVRVMMNYPDGALLCASAAPDETSTPADDAEVPDGKDVPADFPFRDALLPELPLDGADRIHGVAEVWSLRYAAPDRTAIDAYLAALQADPVLQAGMTSSTDNTDMTQFLADDYDLIVAVTTQNDGSIIMTANFTAKD